MNASLKGAKQKLIYHLGAEAGKDYYRLNSLYGVNADSEQKIGVFTLLNYAVNQTTSVSVGARGAQQSSHLTSVSNNIFINRAFVTTIGAEWRATPDLRFYLRRAGSFRFPKADENAASNNGINGLRTQRGVSYETGAQFSRDTMNASLTSYQLDLRDEIAFDPLQTPSQPFGSNQNLAPTKRQGLSLSADYLFFRRLTLLGQYHYVRARLNDGKRIPLVSENNALVGADYKITDHLNIYAEDVYTGNQYAANDNQNTAGVIGGYAIVNANINYQLKNLRAALHLNNIFNHDYYLYTTYQTFNQTVYFYPAPDRNVMLTLSYELNE